jgi:UDP-2,3-diacylglucosamine pyrophosphatase LpxH
MYKKLFCLTFSILVFISCNKDTDLWGVILPYNSANDRFIQSDEWNSEHGFKNIIVSTESYNILVGGDSHIGGVKNFNTFLDEAKKSENTAFVMVGDLVTGRKSDYDVLKENLPCYDSIPYFLLIGNHDLYYNGWKTYFDYFGSSTYYFTVQTPTAKDIYICLDSASGYLGTKEVEWLTNLLSTQRNNFRNCIVFTHLNFFEAGNKWAIYPVIEKSEEFQTLFTQYNVNMVVSGHVHKKTIHIVGNTTYLTVIALMDTNSSVNFLKLSIGSKISFNYKSISNK